MGDRAKLLAEAAAAADLRATGAVSPTPIAAPAPAKPAVKPAAATAAATGAATGAAVTQRRRETPAQREAKAAEQKAAADTWVQEETQKAQQRKEALEAVGRIRDLQRSGQIGETTIGGDEFGAVTRYPSMQSMTISPGERPTVGGAPATPRKTRTVRPTEAPQAVDWEHTPAQELADRALLLGRVFSDSISAYDKGKANLEAKIQSGAVAPIDYKKLAEDQQRRLQDVLNLAAQMREYGYVGTNEQLMDKFAPK